MNIFQCNFTTRNDIQVFNFHDVTAGVTTPVRVEYATLGNALSGIEAFNHPFWKYGKIKNGSQKLCGLADIKMKLGWRFVDGKFVHCNVYPSLIIPTGYKPKAEYMFEPVIGNAQHVGFGGGADINFAFINKNKKYVGLATNVEYHYMFRGTERRSFDLLANGPWSRYLLVYEPATDPYTVKPGINFFTKDVKVTPQSELNWLTTLHAGYKSFFFETGYNFWWKDQEKVVLKNAWNEQIAIAGLFRDLVTGGPRTVNPFAIESVSKATIASSSFETPVDASTVYIQANDLNLKSAAHPSRMSHKVFGALGFQGLWKDLPYDVSAGGGYEFADENKAGEQWSVWLKWNLSL